MTESLFASVWCFIPFRWMKSVVAVGLCALVSAGCATTGTDQASSEVHQFDPAPVASIDDEELKPMRTRPVSELLREANSAFKAANEAQETGDHDAALRHYNLMLELLVEADLDPRLFYDLRDEFDRILASSSDHAKRWEQSPSKRSRREDVALPRRSELAYPYPMPERVLNELDLIQSSYPKNFQRGLERAGRYLPYIRSEFRKAGLPDDLVWLAMVESQFTPKIDSHAGAGGMWQFMKSTARQYGLRVDHYVDERYNWKKATKAAIAYLSDLYDMFDGNWPIALSAYNMGEYGMERAIMASGGERNLWTLIETPPASNHIRLETKRFYSKVLASAMVAKNPARYGFSRKSDSPERTTTVSVKGSYSIRDIEKAADLSRGTLTDLNPQFIRGVTPPDHSSDLLVPHGMEGRIQRALATMPKLRPGVHVVQAGETLSEIAGRYSVSVRDVMNANSIKSARSLQVGQRLVIPGTRGSTPSRSGNVQLASARPKETYTVRRGDSLSRIAERHGTSVEQLQAWNNLGRRTRIRVGDTLYVASSEGSGSAPKGEGSVHTVKKGEFLGKIAANYGVSAAELARWNDMPVNATLRVGEELTVYGGGGETPSPAGGSIEHTHAVKRGETASTIASRYGVSTRDLLTWNGLTPRSILRVGDKLTVKLPADDGREVETVAKANFGGTRMTHTVTKGQNPSTIARRYGASVSELFEWNGWSKTPVLQIGDEVVVYKR